MWLLPTIVVVTLLCLVTMVETVEGQRWCIGIISSCVTNAEDTNILNGRLRTVTIQQRRTGITSGNDVAATEATILVLGPTTILRGELRDRRTGMCIIIDGTVEDKTATTMTPMWSHPERQQISGTELWSMR